MIVFTIFTNHFYVAQNEWWQAVAVKTLSHVRFVDVNGQPMHAFFLYPAVLRTRAVSFVQTLSTPSAGNTPTIMPHDFRETVKNFQAVHCRRFLSWYQG